MTCLLALAERSHFCVFRSALFTHTIATNRKDSLDIAFAGPIKEFISNHDIISILLWVVRYSHRLNEDENLGCGVEDVGRVRLDAVGCANMSFAEPT